MNETKLLSIGKTATLLGVHIDTLREWDKEGKLTPVKTFGNHRRYKVSDLDAFMGIAHEAKAKADKIRVANNKDYKDRLIFPDKDTIIICLSVDTLRCWRDKGVFDLIDTIGGHGVEEIIGLSEKSSIVDG